MAIKTYNPTTPGRRGMSSQDFDAITTRKPLRSLVVTKRRGNGRNNQGRITTRHQGGGARKHYRLVNFDFKGEGTVEHIEYDPNRSARMGNRLPLANIPVGTTIHALELKPGRGAQAVRSAGNSAMLMAKEGDYAQVRMPSGEVRKFLLVCTASVGVVGNEQHQNVKIGKAGRNRHLGKRPSVRGVVMNAADHPHGGGDGGRHGIGSAPKTPWGQKTLGYKTRRRKDTSNMIVRSRHAAKRK